MLNKTLYIAGGVIGALVLLQYIRFAAATSSGSLEILANNTGEDISYFPFKTRVIKDKTGNIITGSAAKSFDITTLDRFLAL